jgi:hypothetical protein
MDGPNDVANDLAAVDRLINAISSDLRRMPDGKRKTRWHLDRLAERRRLMAQRDGLINRQCELALMN